MSLSLSWGEISNTSSIIKQGLITSSFSGFAFKVFINSYNISLSSKANAMLWSKEALVMRLLEYKEGFNSQVLVVCLSSTFKRHRLFFVIHIESLPFFIQKLNLFFFSCFRIEKYRFYVFFWWTLLGLT